VEGRSFYVDAHAVPPREPELTSASRPRGWLRAAAWTLAGLYFLAAAFVLILKYWILPGIGAHSVAIEQALSRALGERVTIAQISARWTGLHAELDLSGLRIYDDGGRVALELPSVQAVIGWRSIPLGSLRLHSLVLDRPDLNVRRDSQGRIFVAGLPLSAGSAGAGSSAWLLSQPEIVVRHARLGWDDETRGAATLELTAVHLVIQNSGDSHRISLRASPPPELASALDLRAAVSGSFDTDGGTDLRDWKGELFAQLDYVDLAAWQQWLDYPLDVRSGRGALRLWASFDDRRITRATADVALAQVRTRLAGDLPVLDIEHLRGRLRGEQSADSAAVAARSVELKLAREPVMPAADFDLTWQAAKGAVPEKGELQADSLALEPLARLAEYLPLPATLRQHVVEAEPRGTLQGMKIAWTGEAGDPRSYSVRGRFTRLGMKKLGDWGGFSGASGTVDATDAGGTVRLESDKVAFDAGRLLSEPHVAFDSLAGSASWLRKGGDLEVGLGNMQVANRDLAGTVNATYAARASGQRVIDLTASFTRVDAKSAHRYIPAMPRGVSDYLRTALEAGTLTDGRLRLKGDLKEFPFADGKSGVFQVSGRIANGEILFAEKWPKVSAIAGDLRIDGPRLQVNASRAAILGARVSNVRVQIPDFSRGDEVVRVEGVAEGAVGEFLRYIEASPVGEMIAGSTRGMSGGGPGRLQLSLDIPIRRLAQTKVQGAFQFTNGTFNFDPGMPQLAQLNGRIDFTEEGVNGRNLGAQFLGGPVTFSLGTRPERAFIVTAQGNASVAAVQRAFDLGWLQRASGAAAWNATVNLGPNRFDMVVESPLAGVSIALPAPLGKRAAETLPLRIERSNRADSDIAKRARGAQPPPGGDAIAFTAGRVANGVFVRRRTAEGYAVQRGAIGINEPAPALEEGLAVAGTFAYLDLDRWRGMGGDAKGGPSPVRSIRLAVNALDAGGKRFNDVRLRATPGTGSAQGGWAVDITSKELEGTLGWQEEGRGRIVARLKRFSVPAPGAESPPQEAAGSEMPALDIIADDFVLGDKKLGKLELVAHNEARTWRIEKLVLTSPDGRLAATGVWQSWAVRPSISLDFKLDVSDSGSYLTRVGFPDTMRGGAATLEGKVGWVGGPQAIDFPTLTGDVRLNASNGQFLRAEPGVAKLLGILSLQTWLSLDFRDALGEGFIFEKMSSNAKIARGILATDDFLMTGKSARVTMAGTVDLSNETQNLKVRAVPSVGDSASTVLGLLLVNPVTALGAMLAQRLLKDPLGKALTADYLVTGTWTDPKVDRVRGETLQPGNNE
jgi:uncharacterized protein (TIGR02099 family)